MPTARFHPLIVTRIRRPLSRTEMTTLEWFEDHIHHCRACHRLFDLPEGIAPFCDEGWQQAREIDAQILFKNGVFISKRDYDGPVEVEFPHSLKACEILLSEYELLPVKRRPTYVPFSTYSTRN